MVHDEFIKSLILGCLVLEELVIQDCHGISMLYVESATLKTLKVGGNVIEESLQLLKSSNSCVVVKAPNLRCLHLRVFLMEYNICDESFLEEVDITVVDVWVTFEAVYQFSTVRSLRLSTNFAHLLYSEEPLNVFAAATFPNLTCLTIRDCCWSLLWMFLCCSPQLKFLVIEYVREL